MLLHRRSENISKGRTSVFFLNIMKTPAQRIDGKMEKNDAESIFISG